MQIFFPLTLLHLYCYLPGVEERVISPALSIFRCWCAALCSLSCCSILSLTSSPGLGARRIRPPAGLPLVAVLRPEPLLASSCRVATERVTVAILAFSCFSPMNLISHNSSLSSSTHSSLICGSVGCGDSARLRLRSPERIDVTSVCVKDYYN